MSSTGELHADLRLGDVRLQLQQRLQEMQQRVHPVGRLLRLDRVRWREDLQRRKVCLPLEHQGMSGHLYRHERLLHERRLPGKCRLFVGACVQLQQRVQGVRCQLHRDLGLLRQFRLHFRAGGHVLDSDRLDHVFGRDLQYGKLLLHVEGHALRRRLPKRRLRS